MMDKVSQEELAKILGKPKRALSDSEKRFLRARRSYLKGVEKKEYADILKAKQAKEAKEVTPKAKEAKEAKEVTPKAKEAKEAKEVTPKAKEAKEGTKK